MPIPNPGDRAVVSRPWRSLKSKADSRRISLGLSREEIQRLAAGYPTILTVEQICALTGLKRKTIHEWSSMGRLRRCARRRGRRLLILRDRFLEEILNGTEW